MKKNVASFDDLVFVKYYRLLPYSYLDHRASLQGKEVLPVRKKERS